MNKRRVIGLTVLIAGILLIAVQTIAQNRQMARPEAPNLIWVGDVSAEGMLSVDQLKARAQQSIPGELGGEPMTEAMYVMTLDDFRAVTGSYTVSEMKAESPVFIYHVTGNFEDLVMVGMSHVPPDTIFARVEIVLDAATGESVQAGIYSENTDFIDYTKIPGPALRAPIVLPTMVVPMPLDGEPLSLPTSASE